VKRLVLISLLVATWLPSARGSLWESKAEIEARYGPAIRVEDHGAGKTYVYSFKRFTVLVTFLDGKSQSELYSRSDGKYLVPVEVLSLLQMNSSGKTWEPTGTLFALVDPVRRGRPIAIAARSPGSAYPRTLHICTSDFVKRFGTPSTEQKAAHGSNSPAVNLLSDASSV
jgi:hypothetical protein